MIFIRHGEAEHNVGFRERGEAAYEDPAYKDSRLTEVGKEQAAKAGLTLKHRNIDIIFTSPLRRCIQTAQIINSQLYSGEAHIVATDDLIEEQGGFHICNVRSNIEELKSEFPTVDFGWCDWRKTVWPDFTTREPAQHVKERVYDLLTTCKMLYKDKNILFVSHHDTIYDTFGTSLDNCHWIEV